MTQARRQLVDPTQAGTFHCINRCVRRSWLCGEDELKKKSYEHRKPSIENRILELGTIFACGIYSYAVMSNHLHLVVHMSPQTTTRRLFEISAANEFRCRMSSSMSKT
jgi:REP element-mobilizing transposase RayT